MSLEKTFKNDSVKKEGELYERHDLDDMLVLKTHFGKFTPEIITCRSQD